MREDAFSKYHPALNFLFFTGSVGFGVIIQHPLYLLAGVLASGLYYLLLNGKKGWKIIGGLFPLFIFLTFINPLLNTRGVTVLFRLFGRPYTLEALYYGVAIAAIFIVTILWFACFNKVLTGDKFACLFGNIIPYVSLLLVMVFRMVPNLIRKSKQIIGVRSSIGKGTESSANTKQKLSAGLTVLSVLISWALEESVVTADSMRSRGYGTAKRSSFMIYRMTVSDWILLAVMLGLIGIVIGFALHGSMKATFVPKRYIASISGINIIGFTSYCAYLLIPTALNVKENIQWNISKFKI